MLLNTSQQGANSLTRTPEGYTLRNLIDEHGHDHLSTFFESQDNAEDECKEEEEENKKDELDPKDIIRRDSSQFSAVGSLQASALGSYVPKGINRLWYGKSNEQQQEEIDSSGLQTLFSSVDRALKKEHNVGFQDYIAQNVYNKIPILLVGPTRSGKSTFGSFMKEIPLVEIEIEKKNPVEATSPTARWGRKKQKEFVIAVKDDTQDTGLISHEDNAHTLVPNFFNTPRGFLYVDCGGTGDTRSMERAAHIALSSKLVVAKSNGVKALVFMLTKKSLLADNPKGKAINDILKYIFLIFEDPTTYAHNIFFGFNKAKDENGTWTIEDFMDPVIRYRDSVLDLMVDKLIPLDTMEVEEITIQTDTLDNVVEALKPTGISLIKIDVEGGEINVLKGASQTIHKFKPLIVFEHGLGASEYYDTKPEAVFAFFNDLNMSLQTMEMWLQKNASGFTQEAFSEQFYKKLNYYFIAYPTN